MLLLDTSVALWLVANSERLGSGAKARLSADALIHASSVTIVEVTVKSMLGKLTVPDEFVNNLWELGIRELALESRDAEAMRKFPELNGHDPFDRMLVAQAEARGMDFLTADRRLLALGRENILDATS